MTRELKIQVEEHSTTETPYFTQLETKEKEFLQIKLEKLINDVEQWDMTTSILFLDNKDKKIRVDISKTQSFLDIELMLYNNHIAITTLKRKLPLIDNENDIENIARLFVETLNKHINKKTNEKNT